MELGKHESLGALTGNPYQPPGKHRELEMAQGCGFIPLGDRTRVSDILVYGVTEVEERGSLDRYSKYSRFT